MGPREESNKAALLIFDIKRRRTYMKCSLKGFMIDQNVGPDVEVNIGPIMRAVVKKLE